MWYEEWKKLDGPEQPGPDFYNQNIYLEQIDRESEAAYHRLYDMYTDENKPIYDELMNTIYGSEDKTEEQLAEEYLAKSCFWERKA